MKNLYLRTFLACSIFLIGHALSAQLVINEYSASNLVDFPDNNLKFEDFVEIYNYSDSSVPMDGWFLTDNANKPEKWNFPDGVVLPPGAHLRVWCSGRDEMVQNHIHTSFKLTQTKGTEILVLSNPSGQIVDEIPLEITQRGHSRARSIDGSNTWVVKTKPTPALPNNLGLSYTGYAATPTTNMLGGFYNGSITVSLSNAEPNSDLHYTTNGHEPDQNDPIYSGPIEITETTVVKGKSFSHSGLILPSKIVFNTYFIDEDDFTLPVFSIAADTLLELANGNRDLRPIGSLEFFELDKSRAYEAYGELNSHGQDSWQNPHRSIDWVTRDEMAYSSTVVAKLFDYSERTDHQRLMFRASGDDNYPATDADYHEGSAHIRDEYVHTLALQGGMELDVRAVSRVIVFLNGNYWGVYGLRERPVDHDYTKYTYDQEKFDLQYVLTWGNTWSEYGGQKAQDDWAEIRDFALNSDMSDPANYDYLDSQVNLTSLIDYMIANLNSVASDWLNYNTGWWRGLNPDGKHKKWGWILWDNDATFDYYINYSGVPNTDPDAVPCDIDQISDFMDNFFGNGDVGKHEKIFLKLQEESETFRQLYYSRQADLMNTIYSCDNMLTTLDEMIAVIEPEMPRQIARWGGSMAEWEANVLKLRQFIEDRCVLVDDGLVECFELEGPYKLTLNVEPNGVGEIDLNTLDIREFPWEGDYFGGMVNLIKARPFEPDEMQFSHWTTANGSAIFPSETDIKGTIEINGAETLTAVFIPAEPNAIDDPVLAEIGLRVTPNLTNNEVNVTFSLEEPTALQMQLINLQGAVIDVPLSAAEAGAGQFSETIALDNLGIAPGVYILNVITDKGFARERITFIK